MSSQPQPLFSLQSVSLQLGKRKILNSFSASIPSDEVTCVIGASGSGKTTFLKLLNGMFLPMDGEILYRGKRLYEYPPRELRRDVAYIAQKPIMFLGTVKDNLLYGPRIWGFHVDDSVLVSLLEKVGLDSSFMDRPAHELSGGEKKRVAIARALVLNPHVLLLDEPTGDLDVVSSRVIEKLVVKLKEEGISIVFVTHDVDEVRRIAERVLVIRDGSLLKAFSRTEFEAIRTEKDLFRLFDQNGGEH